MQPWSRELVGRYEETTFESEVLKGNPLGDPSQRPLWEPYFCSDCPGR